MSYMDYSDSDDIEATFVEHKKKIDGLEKIIKDMVVRIQELEDAVYHGPNSQTMIDAKKSFESLVYNSN